MEAAGSDAHVKLLASSARVRAYRSDRVRKAVDTHAGRALRPDKGLGLLQGYDPVPSPRASSTASLPVVASAAAGQL